MAFFEELIELRKFILSSLIVFLFFSFFFFFLGTGQIELFGQTFYFLSPTAQSFSVQFLEMMRQDLLTPKIQLIVTNPLNAFLAQITVSLFLAFIFSLPFFLFQMIKYLNPTFYSHERRGVLKALVPSLFLFFLGCLFAYFLLIPLSFRLLYSFAERMDALTFFNINEFVTLVMGMMAATGIIFLLPVFMVLLSRLGIIKKGFWKENWRYAILIFLIFSAIITPDGSGLTMLILSVPMAGLYFFGCLLS